MTNPHYFEGDSFDSIYDNLLWWLSHEPQHICSPRGQKIKERLVVTLQLNNPRARLLSCKKRNTNYGFAVGEFLWYWSGKRDLETMLYYNKRMSSYSDDGITLNSAYGYRIRKQQHEFELGGYPGDTSEASQWESCVETLKKDPDSRRALMLINLPVDNIKASLSDSGSKDVPCTLSLQFFIRQNQLDLHVHMRSNDVMWGLTYDLFSFTLMQECMLLELQEKFKDLKLGKYYHTAGSMHLYEPHFLQAEEIVREYKHLVDIQKPMEPLRDLRDIDKVISIEEALRTNKGALIQPSDLEGTTLWMIKQLLDHREKRNKESQNG